MFSEHLTSRKSTLMKKMIIAIVSVIKYLHYVLVLSFFIILQDFEHTHFLRLDTLVNCLPGKIFYLLQVTYSVFCIINTMTKQSMKSSSRYLITVNIAWDFGYISEFKMIICILVFSIHQLCFSAMTQRIDLDMHG